MKKFYAGLAVIGTSAFFSGANAQDYDAQIDALQNLNKKWAKVQVRPILKKEKVLALKAQTENMNLP